MTKRKISAIVAVFVGLLLIALGFFVTRDKPQEFKESKEVLIGVKHANQGQKHLNSLDEKHDAYNSDLPSSGPHYILPAEWGIHTGVVLDEVMVHNEEHGGIIITYKPDLPKDQIAKLEEIANSLQASGHKKGYKVLMFARAKNTKPVQLASWLYTLDLDSVDEKLIKQFYREHLNKSPEPDAV